MVAYLTGTQCPLDNTKMSRSDQSGFWGSCLRMSKYKHVKISASPSGPALWPLPAFSNMVIISLRISLAFNSSSCTDNKCCIMPPFLLMIAVVGYTLVLGFGHHE